MKKAAKANLWATLCIAMVIICAICVIVVARCNAHIDTTLKNQALYVKYVAAFGDASDYLTDQVRAYAATGNIEHYDNYWYEVNTAKNRDKNTALLYELGLTAEEQAMVDSIASISNNLIPIEEEAMNQTAAGRLSAANDLLYGDTYMSGVTEIKDTISKFGDTIQARVTKEYDKLNSIAVVGDVITYIALAVTLSVQVIMALFVTRELIVPIRKTHDIVSDFAAGDLNSTMDMQIDNTEVGETAAAIQEFQTFQKELIDDLDHLLSEMAEGNFNIKTSCEENYKGNYTNLLLSLRKIISTLNDTLFNIRLAADQVDAGSDQVASSAQALSQGATEQASATQELAASIVEVNHKIQQAGTYANEANDKAAEAGRLTSECNNQMQEMVAAMNDISRTSEEIGKIIKTIEDIAFQTNILALNAAVEAARAGSAGKGFAVVADEVRNLAAKSAEASQNTAALIEASMQAVEKGAKIANRTASNLQIVAQHSNQVGEMVGQIATSAHEQADSIQQISLGIDQISSVVQTNSATAEQSAAASQELSSQARVMKDLVDYFKLKGTAQGHLTSVDTSYASTASANFSNSKY